MPPVPWRGLWSLYCFAFAILLAGQLVLGRYMIGLGFYHPWYHKAPMLHKGLGIIIFSMTLVRVAFRIREGIQPLGGFIGSLRYNSFGMQHLFLYMVVIVAVITGFLFAASSGDPVPFFIFGEIPSPQRFGADGREFLDLAHKSLVWGLGSLALIHGAQKLSFMVWRK